jgi:hypothetical protein
MLIVATPSYSRTLMWIVRRSRPFIGSSAIARPPSIARLTHTLGETLQMLLARVGATLDVEHNATHRFLVAVQQLLVRKQLERIQRTSLARRKYLGGRTLDLYDRVRAILALADLERPDLEAFDHALHELPDLAERAAHGPDDGSSETAGARGELALARSRSRASNPPRSRPPRSARVRPPRPRSRSRSRPPRHSRASPRRDRHASDRCGGLRSRGTRPRRCGPRGRTPPRDELLDEQLIGRETEECARLLERGLPISRDELVRFLLGVVHGSLLSPRPGSAGRGFRWRPIQS